MKNVNYDNYATSFCILHDILTSFYILFCYGVKRINTYCITFQKFQKYLQTKISSENIFQKNSFEI